MYRRRKKTLYSQYQQEFSQHINQSVSMNKVNIKRSFILVGSDMPNEYPKPDSVIAVTANKSTDRYWYVRTGNTPPPLYMADDDDFDIDEKRSFTHEPATFDKGTDEPRYFMVVDHINEDGEIVCYDDMDKPHTFLDTEVMVVDLYLYPSSSYDSTFYKGYEIAEQALATRIMDVMESERILNFLCDSPCMCYERGIFVPTSDDRTYISNIYKERGLLLADDQPVIRVRFENCVIDGMALNENGTQDLIPYAKEVINELHFMGYHIDLISETYIKNGGEDFKTFTKFLENAGLKYNSLNGMLKYDSIVDTRNLMNFAVIDWTHVYRVLTNKEFILVPTGDEMDVQLGDLPVDSDENTEVIESSLNNVEEIKDHSDLITIEKEKFEALKESDTLLALYPLSPIEWEVVKELQNKFNSTITYDEMDDRWKQLVDTLGLKGFFE